MITEKDLYRNQFTNSLSFIIKGTRYIYKKRRLMINKYKQRVIDKPIGSKKQFIEFLNLEYNKHYFQDKFNKLINE